MPSSDTVLVYPVQLTPRLRYIFSVIFRDILGVEVKFTSDAGIFSAYEGVKVSYGEQPVGDEVFFPAARILFERGIIDQQLSPGEWNGCKVLYSMRPRGNSLPFDPFASAFYMVSRYEEYLPHMRDQYDRFNASQSIALQKGFLRKPVVNRWAEMVADEVRKKYPVFSFPRKQYRYISTIDVDNAYAYLEKGLLRSLGAYARSLVGMNGTDFRKRTRVLLRMERDPYDTYDQLVDIQKKYQLPSVYFFLVGDYGVNDKNISISSRRFQSLIKSMADYAQVGIHPSFGSGVKPERIREEISRLSKVLKRDITKSRQHFLKLRFPETYRRLIENDITDDYTMGYATDVGFRAGICTPYPFYDLDLETTTPLTIHPFAVMDATLRYYLRVKPEEAVNYVKPLVEEVKAVNGTFISLWHNESLSENEIWKGWNKVYEEIVKIARE